MKEKIYYCNPHMTLEWFPNKAITYYSKGPIEKVQCTKQSDEYDCLCTLSVYSGENVWEWSSRKLYLTGFIMYGIPISLDGSKLFAPQSNGGLICYELITGKILWKTKSKAEYSHIFVNPNTICCAKSRNEIQLIDIETGEVIKSHKTPFDNRFEVLSDDYILNHTRSKWWEVLSPHTLETVQTIGDKELVATLRAAFPQVYKQNSD